MVQIKIWYAPDSNLSVCPQIFLKGIPGLVMSMETSNVVVMAVDIQKPSITKGYFSFDTPLENFHTREEYDRAVLEYNKNLNLSK
jgi:hypothetical protein